MKTEIPRWRVDSGSLRAANQMWLAVSAREVQIF